MKNRKVQLEEIIESMHIIKLALIRDIPQSIKKTPLSDSQLFVLKIVDGKNYANLKDISEALNITNSASTQLVNTLVKKGLLKRITNPRDRRYVEIRLSPSCKKQIKPMKERGLKKFNNIFSALNDKELKKYSELNKRIIKRILENNKKTKK